MAIPPAVSQTRQTLAGILAGATVATGVFAAGLAVTAPQTQSTTGTVVADSEDNTAQTTAPTTSTVTSPGTSTRTSHTSTRGS